MIQSLIYILIIIVDILYAIIIILAILVHFINSFAFYKYIICIILVAYKSVKTE